MGSSKSGLSTLLAAAAIAMVGAGIPMAEPKQQRRSLRKPNATPGRWITQTQEQREWNAAVDARKAAKKGAKG